MSKITIGTLCLDTDHIIGFALIDKASKYYGLFPGLYPIVYFEERSVSICVDCGDPDFMCVSREDFEWINL